MPSFKGFGKAVRAITLPMVCLFALIVVPSFLASGANRYSYGSSDIFGEGTAYGKDKAATP